MKALLKHEDLSLHYSTMLEATPVAWHVERKEGGTTKGRFFPKLAMDKREDGILLSKVLLHVCDVYLFVKRTM